MADDSSDQSLVIRDSAPADPSMVTPAERRRAAQIREIKLNAVLSTWKTAADEELKTRSHYANQLLKLLAIQALVVNIAFFMIGFKCIDIDEVTARVFVVSVFTELAAMVFWIVKYLFSRNDEPVLRLIEKI